MALRSFLLFYLLLKKSLTTLCFKLSIYSRTNKLSMFSTRKRILFPRVLNRERSCSVCNASSTLIVKGRVGGVLSLPYWSSWFSSFFPSIILVMISSSLEKEADVTTSISRSANDSADRFGWAASLSKRCNFLRTSCKLLNGLLSSFTAVCCFYWLMLDFLKQLIMVSFDMTLHDDTKCFIAWRILIFAGGLLLSTALIQRGTTFFRQWALRLCTTPWSIGWRTDVVSGGRKIRLKFVRFLTSEWAGQLSIRKAAFLLWAGKEESSFFTHSSNKTPVILLFFWALYRQESCFTI